MNTYTTRTTHNSKIHDPRTMNQSLPPNPYPAFSEELRSQFYAPSELSYDLQIACLTGIFGLCLVLVLASLGIRYWTKTFWVFATRKTVAGTWIVPHPIVTWSIMLGELFTRESRVEGGLKG
jgi:hypothetical protein